MTNINVECSFCHNNFDMSARNYNWSNKQKSKKFCSKECRNKFFTKSKRVNCLTCGKEMTVTRSQVKQSKSGKFFCSHTCSAKHSNANRVFSEERRKEISEKTRSSIGKYLKTQNKIMLEKNEERTCPICNKKFKPPKQRSLCCSRRCRQIYQFGSSPYTKEEVINRIYEVSQKLKRTPQRRECEHKLWHSANKFFGSWNKLMEHCGLKPNSSKYQKIRLKCQDGHMADSISEKIIDEWLFVNKINHERNKKYHNVNFNCDFYLPDYNIWLEYFGLMGQVEEYDKGIELKRQIVKDNNLNFIEIVPNDLYPENKLDSFLVKIKNAPVV